MQYQAKEEAKQQVGGVMQMSDLLEQNNKNV
jgi:hypothetical protein